ncbi:MAG TPA: IclR family transcriptional regulator C-terminal domain-containing protein [Pseudolabrys sp.]|jgi:DNA-binding IclR family transcriptional regulator|nr:IclR family transcriptional regulator C-terminal domain-containing protein [Pseudolabrys sp.]
MGGPNRLISVLQLFDNGRSVWTVDEIAEALTTSPSTAYRSVRALVQGGFLDPVTGAGYALGPAFIRYDRVLRQNDPLIKAADLIMSDLLSQTDQGATVILCRRFRDCVMCVHEVQGAKPHAPTSYQRGVAMPMFIGATSKIILAHLPDRVLKSTYLSNEQVIRRVLKVQNWQQFREQLKAIRRAGIALTDSEVAKGRIGVAAPIVRESQVIASISLVIAAKALGHRKAETMVSSVLAAASRISRNLSREKPLVTRG